MNYYNEFDPKAAAWLRELIKQGHIPPGEVDTRSITEVSPSDLNGFTQCHFFAGIAGWPFALHLAGVDSTRPLWTGSCPCQPFSVAGKGLGTADERHLWPAFARLIAQCAPPVVFGEQVASKAGRQWLHGVRADLEGMGYAVGAADLCAAGAGAPHIRQRLYWVADAENQRCEWRNGRSGKRHSSGESERPGLVGGLAHSDGWNASAEREQRGREHGCLTEDGGHGGLEHAVGLGREALWNDHGKHDGAIPPTASERTSGLADPTSLPGAEQRDESGEGSRRGEAAGDSPKCAGPGGLGDASTQGLPERGDGWGAADSQQSTAVGASPPFGVAHSSLSEGTRLGPQREHLSGPAAWSNFDILPCTDGKTRRIESGVHPLAHGVPGRVELLRGYGNAIVPQVAAVFIEAVMS